jgi:hypothetical protein
MPREFDRKNFHCQLPCLRRVTSVAFRRSVFASTCELESSYGESRPFIAPNLEAPYSGRTMMGEL